MNKSLDALHIRRSRRLGMQGLLVVLHRARKEAPNLSLTLQYQTVTSGGWLPVASQEFQGFLAESRTRLLASVDGLAPDQLTKRPAPERWSPLEVMEHVALAEEWFLQIVSGLVEEGQRQGLRYIEGQPRSTDAVAALAAQIDIRQPQVAADFAQPSGSVSLPVILERLGRSRQGLLDLLPALDELDTDQLKFRHPTIGFELNAYQWVHMSGVHDRMHARQIRTALDTMRS